MRLAACLLALGLLAPCQAFAACAGESMLPAFERDRPEIWSEALADLASTPNGTGVFWKIEKDGIAPSSLLGSMHVPDPDITVLRPEVAEALSSSHTLVLELADLGEESKAALAEKIIPVAKLPDGESFDTDFTQAEKDKLGDMSAAIGMPYFAARRMQPWFLAISLSMPPCVQLAMLQGEKGIDEMLESEARDKGKSVIGLETIDEQIETLAGMKTAIGADDLKEMVKLGPGGLADLFATLLQLYVQERPWLYVSLSLRMPEFKESAAAFSLVETALLLDRNRRMHDRLLPILAEGNVFVAVGALHLPGDEGLIELLRASGYTLTRIE
jgi:uncharacterized protein YbaP (TraB family)